MSITLGSINYAYRTSAVWEINLTTFRSRRNTFRSIKSPKFLLCKSTCHFIISNAVEDGKYRAKLSGMNPTISHFYLVRSDGCTDRIISRSFTKKLEFTESDLQPVPDRLFPTEKLSLCISIHGEVPRNNITIPEDEINNQEAPRPESVELTPGEACAAGGEAEKQETDMSNKEGSLNEISAGKSDKQGQQEETPRSKSAAKLISDLKESLLSEKNSDVILKVDGRDFKAHRFMLGSRSPVFAAMFDHEMKEKNSGVVVIQDSDQETFPDFLHYIYTGTVENLSSEKALQLYVAADKYQLAELKEECLDYMKNNISVDHFCDVMAISLLHQEWELTKIATEFFLVNAAEITPTVKWMTFLSLNVTAGNELIVKLAMNTEKR